MRFEKPSPFGGGFLLGDPEIIHPLTPRPIAVITAFTTFFKSRIFRALNRLPLGSAGASPYIQGMKQIILAAFLATTAAPASADFLKDFEQFSEESQKFLEGWVDKIGPSIEAFGPALDALMEKIDDWTFYELPEVLPNGDIIIRRKQSAPKLAPPAPQKPDDKAIDL